MKRLLCMLPNRVLLALLAKMLGLVEDMFLFRDSYVAHRIADCCLVLAEYLKAAAKEDS